MHDSLSSYYNSYHKAYWFMKMLNILQVTAVKCLNSGFGGERKVFGVAELSDALLDSLIRGRSCIKICVI